MTSQSPTEPLQHTVGVFQDQNVAETARNVLLMAGFSNQQISIETQDLDPNPPMKATQAKQNAGGGAVIGTILGGLMGVLLSFNGQTLSAASPVAFTDASPFSWAYVLAGSGVGAVAGALIAALAGVNVPKEAGVDRDRLSQKYLLTLEGTREEAERAEELVQHQT